mmetsp:Transcript_90343/g.281241  ORF Transcript_90343/g.281241 Transcript_90343/m.281241 type:complete len:205 (-) Transcript_90343:111-725(-)
MTVRRADSEALAMPASRTGPPESRRTAWDGSGPTKGCCLPKREAPPSAGGWAMVRSEPPGVSRRARCVQGPGVDACCSGTGDTTMARGGEKRDAATAGPDAATPKSTVPGAPEPGDLENTGEVGLCSDPTGAAAMGIASCGRWRTGEASADATGVNGAAAKASLAAEAWCPIMGDAVPDPLRPTMPMGTTGTCRLPVGPCRGTV